MSDPAKIAKNLERFRIAVAAHDRENPPPHTPAHGIALSHFDMDRLDFDEGETLWPGITVHADDGVTGNFRVLCDGDHEPDEMTAEEQAAITRAIGVEV